MSSSWSFPFSTCEKPVRAPWGKSQPVSGTINMISTVVLLCLAFLPRSIPFLTRIVIFGFALLEGAHSYSHFKLIKGKFQFRFIHIINYFIVFAAMLNLQFVVCKKRKILFLQWFILFTAFLLEFYFFLCGKEKNIKHTVVGGTLLFLLVLCFYLPYIPTRLYPLGFVAICVLSIGIINFYLETVNCKKWMETVVLPYHATIEILTMIFLLLVSSLFIGLTKKRS